jgi:hypothetical protein
MTTMTTPTIETSKIDVAEGFNARTNMEADGIARLSASSPGTGNAHSSFLGRLAALRYRLLKQDS